MATTSLMTANKQRRCHSPISPVASEAVGNNNNLVRILFPEAAYHGRNVVHFESRPAAPTPNPQRSSSTPKGEETTVQLDLGLLAPGNWVNDLAMMRIALLFKPNTLAIVNPLELEHFCKAKHLPDKVRDKYLVKIKHNPITVHTINNSAEMAALYVTSIHLVTHGSPLVAASHLRVRAESNLAAKHARIPPPCRCSGPQRPTAWLSRCMARRMFGEALDALLDGMVALSRAVERVNRKLVVNRLSIKAIFLIDNPEPKLKTIPTVG
ncbi:hypothetical protein QBC33DRAFT_520033 [Phialemonium atrogriseum]|uniref:Uncharacterized protein n=1 Tax=Phialemonium atrogriseum TaxID=1093897 RepID=A0AAJ0BP72_9PEZI|nr:uncharacterized protein QBC33DRAFT_520033 [Phialemonium atrogriseum]KAK1761919.1 hypothetical protein QBC33DRAFT_520033 [Phialemonium atrogriseum]